MAKAGLAEAAKAGVSSQRAGVGRRAALDPAIVSDRHVGRPPSCRGGTQGAAIAQSEKLLFQTPPPAILDAHLDFQEL